MDTRIIIKTNPWILVLQGIIMLAAGIFVLSNPEVTLVALTRLLGIIMLIAAGFLLFSSTYKREKINQLLFIEGIVNAGLGIVFTLFPALLPSVSIVILGVIAFLSGLLNLWMLIRERARISSAPFLRNSLVLIFGILLLVNPAQGREAVAVIIGIFAVVFGLTSFYGAYKLWSKKE